MDGQYIIETNDSNANWNICIINSNTDVNTHDSMLRLA